MSRLDRLRSLTRKLKQADADSDRTRTEKAARAAGQASKLAGAGSRAVARRVDTGELGGPDGDDDYRTVAERAERAGQARAPVKSSLALTSDPRQIERFAASGMSVDAAVRGRGDDGTMEELVTGMSDPNARREVTDEDGEPRGALDFADPFGVSGTDDRDDGGGLL